jgi:hypothetical protein
VQMNHPQSLGVWFSRRKPARQGQWGDKDKNHDALFDFFLSMDDLSSYILPIICKCKGFWIGLLQVSKSIFLVKRYRLGSNYHDRFEQWTRSNSVTTDPIKERTYALLSHLHIVLITVY